jgi:hypothetical protein
MVQQHVTDVNKIIHCSFVWPTWWPWSADIVFGSDLDIGDTKRHPRRNPLRHGYSGVAAPMIGSTAPPTEVDTVVDKEWFDEPRA